LNKNKATPILEHRISQITNNLKPRSLAGISNISCKTSMKARNWNPIFQTGTGRESKWVRGGSGWN